MRDHAGQANDEVLAISGQHSSASAKTWRAQWRTLAGVGIFRYRNRNNDPPEHRRSDAIKTVAKPSSVNDYLGEAPPSPACSKREDLRRPSFGDGHRRQSLPFRRS